MPTSTLILVLLVLTVAGFMMGRSRALATAGGTPRELHSVPSYYGFYVAIWAGIPALLLMLTWLALEPVIIKNLVLASLPAEQFGQLTESELELAWVDVRNLATGNIVREDPSAALRAAADHYLFLESLSNWALFLVGAGAWAAVRQPWADFDDINVPMDTDPHHVEHPEADEQAGEINVHETVPPQTT